MAKILDLPSMDDAVSLVSLILNESFEYGIDTKADVLVRDYMGRDAIITQQWLNEISLEYISNTAVLVGLLRIIARFDYQDVCSVCQTMVIEALGHEDIEVQECGIRVFESWGTVKSLEMLENLKVTPLWLQEYVDEVVLDLRKEHNVALHQGD